MNKFLFTLPLILLSLNVCSAASKDWNDFSITFPIQESADSSVVFSYKAKAFVGSVKDPAIPLEEKKRDTMDREEIFIANIVAQNAAGDKEKILNLWVESERNAISESMKSEEAFERNSAFFRNIEATYLISVIKYNNYYLFCVEHNVQGIGSYRKIYPATNLKGSYFMTNALKGDVFYEKIVTDLLPYVKDAKIVK
jgi:hypothetical protein